MRNSLAQRYVERALDILLGLDGVEESSRLRDSGIGLAVLTASLSYPDSSRLAIRLIVDYDSSNWTWPVYSFHYMTRHGVCIFRYDNSMYHPEVSSFPHHKHEGADERVVACRQPSVRAIRDEIEFYLRSNSG